jgi:peptide/nickel transport system ATP-binding protein
LIPRPAAGRSEPDFVLEAKDLVRHFELSPGWLGRALGRRRLVVRAVDGVGFAIGAGETFSLVGESGSGKSTIARLVVGLDRPTRGSVLVRGAPPRESPRGSRIGVVFQDPQASLDPRWRAGDIVAEPLLGRAPRRERQARAAELLTAVGLSPADAARHPHQFSGGQRQRISIARALAADPRLLVCDEPTSALDVSVQAQILNLVRDLQQRLGFACLFISHDLAVVRHVSTRVGLLYLGRLVETGDARDVFRSPAHPYTRMLLDSVPDLSGVARRRKPIPGEIPSPMDPPPGCAFHPRCPQANARCAAEVPALLPRPGGGSVACHAIEEGRV